MMACLQSTDEHSGETHSTNESESGTEPVTFVLRGNILITIQREEISDVTDSDEWF